MQNKPMYVVYYTSSSALTFTLPMYRSFKTENEARKFISRMKKGDEERGVTRTIEYLGKKVKTD